MELVKAGLVEAVLVEVGLVEVGLVETAFIELGSLELGAFTKSPFGFIGSTRGREDSLPALRCPNERDRSGSRHSAPCARRAMAALSASHARSVSASVGIRAFAGDSRRS